MLTLDVSTRAGNDRFHAQYPLVERRVGIACLRIRFTAHRVDGSRSFRRTDTLPTPSPTTMRRGESHQWPHGKNVVRSGDIKALTGLRIVAAVWVVLFHFRPLLRDAVPGFLDALTPVLNCGAQGVDLFFILSGFVLTWNYLDRMGGSWSTRATLHFLWLRLARVWPVYLVTLHLAALWVIFTLHVGHIPSQDIYRFTAISYVRQVLMVQLWFQPFFDDSSWDGPAWSISAEWLAYLLFGLVVLVIFRMARATRARNLVWLAVAASLPPVVSLLVTRPVLHTVELAAAHRHAVHRRGTGRCCGQPLAARPIVAAARPATSRPCCSRAWSASSTGPTRTRCTASPTPAVWSTSCLCRWC